MTPVRPGPAVEAHLRLMEAQREEFFEAVASVGEERVWERPAEDRWCAGEHIDHARILTRCARRILRVAWPIGWPWGRLRRRRPYATTIDDVYERPGFPLKAGWLWPPKHRPHRAAPLSRLRELFTAEHRRVHRFYASRDERVLGQIRLFDPAIGWVNLIQALRIGVHHDAHHFRIARRLVGL